MTIGSSETAAGSCPRCQAEVGDDLAFCRACGAPLTDHLLGQVIEDRYSVVRRLGAGSMGAVYAVKHVRLDKRFAMKVIHRDLARLERFADRFEREALATSKLEHPNCISVTDYGRTASGEPYLVMEYLEGQPLAELMDEPMPVARALDVVRQVLQALQHAHQAGVFHRDVKPENVMLLPAPRRRWLVKLLDFGIARLAQEGSSRRITQPGVISGTPSHMAPEQAAGENVDQRGDLYAVGVILWELLTGRRLFEAEDPAQVLYAKLSRTAPGLDEIAPGAFSLPLQQLVARALARAPDDRFASAGEFIEALAQVERAPGRGLATERGAPLRRALRGLPETVLGCYGSWYRCQGHVEPSWRRRARDLTTTRRGALVLCTALAPLLVGGLLLAAVGGNDGGSDPPRPGSAIAAAGTGAAPGTSTGRAAGTSGATTRRPAKPARASPDAGSGAAARLLLAAPTATERKQLAAARRQIGRGRCEAAATALTAVVGANPGLAAGHLLLGRAELCRSRLAPGLASLRRAIVLDPRLRTSKPLRKTLLDALADKEQRTAVLAFVVDALGKDAPSVLVGATTDGDRAFRRRVIALLLRLGGSDKIDWVTVLHLELEDEPDCKRRASIVRRLGNLDDRRALPLLRNLRRRRRHRCLRKAIDAAIAKRRARR